MIEQETIESRVADLKREIAQFKNPQPYGNGQILMPLTVTGAAYDFSIVGDFSTKRYVRGFVSFTNDSGQVPLCQIELIGSISPGGALNGSAMAQLYAQRMRDYDGSVTYEFRYLIGHPSFTTSQTIYWLVKVISNDTGTISVGTWSIEV